MVQIGSACVSFICSVVKVQQRELTARVMLMNLEKPYSVKAMTAKAMYVPRMPRLAMVGRFLKKAFFLTDSPACRMMGGRKKLHASHHNR